MSPAEALLYFTLQVFQTRQELNIQEPVAVEEMNFSDAQSLYGGKLKRNSIAFIATCVRGFECERKVVILEDQLTFSKGNRFSQRKWLRCIARHEVTHILLGHLYGAKDPAEDDIHHYEVRVFMRQKWNEDSSCS